jgi:non-ribosomal peptide synthetase component F
MVDRNVGSLAAFMGVLYSGNFYVPLDNQMPVNRITSILKQLEPVALLFFEKDRRLIGQLELNARRSVMMRRLLTQLTRLS